MWGWWFVYDSSVLFNPCSIGGSSVRSECGLNGSGCGCHAGPGIPHGTGLLCDYLVLIGSSLSRARVLLWTRIYIYIYVYIYIYIYVCIYIYTYATLDSAHRPKQGPVLKSSLLFLPDSPLPLMSCWTLALPMSWAL